VNQYKPFIVTSDGKLSPWVYGEEVDHRTDSEKLRQAFEDYIEAAGKLRAACDGSKPPPTEQLFTLLEDRKDNAHAAMVNLFEDQTLVPWSLVEKAVMG
jgi:hypothetical protein